MRRDDRQADRCGVAGMFSSSSPRPRAGAGRGRARGGSSSRRGRARHTGLACHTSLVGRCTSRCARATGSLRFARRASSRTYAPRSRRRTSPPSASSTSPSRAIMSISSSRETRPSRSFAGYRGSVDAAPRPSIGPPRGEAACGAVESCRYHSHALRTPTEARRGLVYVLLNFRKHLRAAPGVDPRSSGPWFGGWRTSVPAPSNGVPVVAPRTWLATVGWRHAGGAIAFDERPAHSRASLNHHVGREHGAGRSLR